MIAAPAGLHTLCPRERLQQVSMCTLKSLYNDLLEEADAIIDAGRAANRHLMVGHLLQYHPIFSRLRDLVKQGALEELQYLYSNRFSLGKIRAKIFFRLHPVSQ